ncbi:MAG: hypothetical protein KKA32_02355 [Actinobacteria bacterium]|nr:hypothetical protein [Actinomycetota bacterium]
MHTRAVAYLELATAAGILGFWVLFFAGAMSSPDGSSWFLAHEHAFVAPDIVLAGVLLGAAIQLLREKPSGRTLSLLAAGALVFLALYDFGFEVSIGFDRTPSDRLTTTIMDLWLLGLGGLLALRRY